MNAPATTAVLRPGLSTGAVTALVAVVIGTVLALVGGAGGPLAAARTGARGWLVLQGSGLETGAVTLTLVPVGGVLLCAALTGRVAVRFVREPLEAPGAFAAVVAGTAGLVAAVLATATSTGDLVVHPVRAAAAAFVVNGLGAVIGVSLAHGRVRDLLPTQRTDVHAVVAAAARGVWTLLVASAVLVVALLLVSIDRAAQLWALLDPGVGGALPLALICLLALPTAVLWTTSVLLGPGFALGTQTSVDLSGAQLGPVPGLPVLAALPSPGAFPDVVVLLGLVPLLAGAVAGYALVHRSDPAALPEALWPRLGFGAAAGGLAGAVCGLAVGLSGGAVGPGRLAETGPEFLWPVLLAVPVLALGGAVGALAAHYRERRGEPSPERSERSSSADATSIAGRLARARSLVGAGAARRPRLRIGDESAGADRRRGES